MTTQNADYVLELRQAHAVQAKALLGLTEQQIAYRDLAYSVRSLLDSDLLLDEDWSALLERHLRRIDGTAMGGGACDEV
jgi:hypothetical protein